MSVSFIDLAVRSNVRIPHRNTRPVRFNLSKYGTASPLNVSTATGIVFEWDSGGVVQTPIVANPAHPDADWGAGAVVVVLAASDVTAEVGNYPFSLTVTTGVSVETLIVGTVEVYARPGYTV